MSSTNKTEKLNLSQFIATDKPAWLTDYNNDMQKIDAGIAGMQGTVSAAVEASKENGIAVYTHSKSGTVHTLAGKGNNIKFKATADFVTGDTIEIAGVPMEVKGEPDWKSGDTVLALLDGVIVNFKSGGGNMKVFAAETLPITVKDSYIVVITSAMGSITAGGEKPIFPKVNDIHISLDIDGKAPIKISNVTIYSKLVEQWNGSRWIYRDAYMGITNKWVQLQQPYYLLNDEFAAITGGFTQANGSGTFAKNANSMVLSGGMFSVLTSAKVDLTKIDKLHVRYATGAANDTPSYAVLVVANARTADPGYTTSFEVWSTIPLSSSGEQVADVSSLSGTHYIGFVERNTSLTVSELWGT